MGAELLLLAGALLAVNRPADTPAEQLPEPATPAQLAADQAAIPPADAEQLQLPLAGVSINGRTGDVQVSPAFVRREVAAAIKAASLDQETDEQRALLRAAAPWCATGEVGGAWLELPCEQVNDSVARLEG